jgi:hypothetical protein
MPKETGSGNDLIFKKTGLLESQWRILEDNKKDYGFRDASNFLRSLLAFAFKEKGLKQKDTP